MTSKIRIRMGQLEVECEGTEEFLKKELPALLTAISTLYKESRPDDSAADSDAGGGGRDAGRTTPPTGIVGTTGSLAAKLKVVSGSDLVIAASAQLTIVQGKATFGRKELIAEMRSASGYFSENHISNLSKILKALVAGQKLNEISANTYALKAAEKERLEKKLA